MITDVEVARTAAEAGAAVVRRMFGESLPRVEKGEGDFATAADVAAEKAILDVIRTARPGDTVTGEETGRTGPAEAERTGPAEAGHTGPAEIRHTGSAGAGHTGPAEAERGWLVDPLCGTLNYAVHTMLASVNVALRVGESLTAAAVADPFSDEVFWTDGVRAHARRGGVDTPLRPSAESRLVDVNLDPPFPNAPAFHPTALLADPGFAARFRPRVVSTTLAVAWVAAGRRAAYVTDGHQYDSVHFAAGIALCQAAGCVVTGLDGLPPHTGTGGLLIAADQPTHTALLDLIGAR
ncbi:phosphatase [Sphaerisporangium siamense]|uniref:Myo-inositol-1(Or 4)-monophosphatase n=1 Tax=Sphaerisporangium siamense TaxID=795645 RepID=A0A7W7D8Y0_9ACTN|nr:inositol monophosphatase family protein [Sphaerisporangium siamense]MBB4701570.1 myo-inositol-1(or 4)-monophosphatase [Sphaerisporangium siamense]GII85696.1 phosphatase [Sphaerisporangium siamense]